MQMNKRKTLLLILIFLIGKSILAQKVDIYHPQIPILTDGEYNIVLEVRIDIDKPMVLNDIEVEISPELPLNYIKSIGMIYTGGASSLNGRTKSWTLRDQVKRLGGSQKLFRNPSYGIEIAKKQKIKNRNFSLNSDFLISTGENYIAVCIKTNSKQIKDLTKSFKFKINRIKIDNIDRNFSGDQSIKHRFGVAVRQAGDYGIHTYRIPAFATTKNGTLVAAFDVRNTYSFDVQEDIDIGISRSFDGGKTWGKNQIIIDMKQYGNLPEAQNGLCDPSILVDEITGDLLVVASWSHGFANNKVFGNKMIKEGLEPEQTPQMLIVRSSDNGKTWSQPLNITKQVKQPKWNFTFQGPGKGITMNNGTLVFPIQYINTNGLPNSAIMYSVDRGFTWKTHNYPINNTTESQVVQLADGRLMLNMRNNRKTGRLVYTTSDMGYTWVEHPSSEKTLIEPVCNAGLIRVNKEENTLGRDILFFVNPNSVEGRKNITIKASLDEGNTWPLEHQLQIDEETGWGYASLSMVDKSTLGVFYESSTAQLLFQAIKINDIIKIS